MIDSKDLLILDALKENAKASIVALSKKTGLPATTIHDRINKMRKDGTILGYTIKVDPKKAGKEIGAFISITVDYLYLKEKNSSMEALIERISKLPLVEEISLVTGGTDILIKCRMKDIAGLNNFVMRKLRNFDGVEKTQTMVILREAMG